MSRAISRPRGSPFQPGSDHPKPDEILRQLRIILDSPAFHGSKRCQQFLEYVCQKTLAGEGETLKERTVAIEVFGRRPQSDLGEDTIVRVGAREVRKRLAQFYVLPEGGSAEIRIDLPPGTYVPEFRYTVPVKEEPEVTPGAPGRDVAEEPLLKSRLPLWAWVGGGLVLMVAGILALSQWSAKDPATAAFESFWAPVFQSSERLLLAVGHPLVYHPSMRALRLSEERQPPQQVPLQRPIQVPPGELDGSDLVPVQNQYVGFGDMVAATELSSMLARKSKGIRVRLASGVPFADLRQSQTLLVGALTNRWTMEFGQAWRFQFVWQQGFSGAAIRDTADAGGKVWTIPPKADGSAIEDYVLLCRIRNSPAGGLLLVGAGLKQFGTEAAGRVLSDPNQLGSLLAKLPAGWEAKNLQIVLHTRVIGNAPAQPELVAWHVW